MERLRGLAFRLWTEAFCGAPRSASGSKRKGVDLAASRAGIRWRRSTESKGDGAAAGDVFIDDSRRRPHPHDERLVSLGYKVPRYTANAADGAARQVWHAMTCGLVSRER